MFGLDVGDRYKKYQTLFLQATQKNKTLAKQVKELNERVTELEAKLTESLLSRRKAKVDETPVKKKRTAKAKSKRNVKVAQEQTNDRDTDTTD